MQSLFSPVYEVNQSCVLYLVSIISKELNWKERRRVKVLLKRSFSVWKLHFATYLYFSLEFYRARDMLLWQVCQTVKISCNTEINYSPI